MFRMSSRPVKIKALSQYDSLYNNCTHTVPTYVGILNYLLYSDGNLCNVIFYFVTLIRILKAKKLIQTNLYDSKNRNIWEGF